MLHRKVFFGARPGGLVRVLNNRFKGFTVQEGLPASGVSAVSHAPDGRVWLRDRNGELHIYNKTRFDRLEMQERFRGGALGSFGFDGEGNLWTKTGRTLAHYENGRMVPLKNPDGKLDASGSL